jgi:hypothetical protein
VTRGGSPAGLLTRYDLLQYWTTARDEAAVAR